jgi:hypothetical protein
MCSMMDCISVNSAAPVAACVSADGSHCSLPAPDAKIFSVKPLYKSALALASA